uniref:Uncharacterized protein n=1 Tax=Lactuca sativa TaxID=4236 RepID=A0A9R1V214_LACSA|nr:hypothetical protein LSAT_V11C700356160 [Lactuca sativa]
MSISFRLEARSTYVSLLLSSLNCYSIMVDMVAGKGSSSTVALGRGSVFFYGVGHMLNDITAACWFTYLLVFMTDIGLSPRNAAIVMLSGQIADGFTTIFAGELIDRFGHFKVWHAAGSILVAISFSSVFGGCVPCIIFGNESTWLQTIGYSFFAAVFNVGWAATQVSHMSMVNCITLNSTSRVVLTSCQPQFICRCLLGVPHLAFENHERISLDCVLINIHWMLLRGRVSHWDKRAKEDFHGEHGYQKIAWTYWFKKVLYYQVALVYVFTRLITNVSQIPAMIYICSFIVSILLQVPF